MASGISRETFSGMDVDSKLDVLFDYARESRDDIAALKKRPFFDKCFSFAGGIIGGFLAALGVKWGV